MATYRADITKSIEPAMANPALLGQAAKAKAGAITTLAGLAEDVYKGYVAGEIAKVEEEAAATAGEFFISGQAASEAARRASAVQTARGTLFGQFDESAPLEQQEAVGKQLGAFDNELRRLKDAVEGGMSNERYVSRIDSITKTAIAKFPGLANQIRERVAAVTGMPGADRWAQMSYVRERFSPPKEGKQPKTPEDMALQDIDEAAKTGMFGTREELLNIYRTDRAKYDERMTGFKQVLTNQTQTKSVEAYNSRLTNQSDADANQQRASFAAIFSGSLGTSVLTQAVQDKEQVFGTVLGLMAKGENVAVNIVPFETTIKLHQAQMRTNIEQARRVAYTSVQTYINNNPNISDAKRKELFADVDRMATDALGKYADDKGVGLVAMANIMRTYRDKTLQEKQQLVDLAIKQQTAMQNNPMVMAYWAGGVDRENLKRTNRSFYEFMVGQENELVTSIGGVRNDVKTAGDLANVERVLKQSQQSPAAVPIDPVASANTTRAAHQAQMASAQEVLKKAELSQTDVFLVSAALSTSTEYGANSQNLPLRYKTIGERISKLPEPDQAVIKSNVSNSVQKSVASVQSAKTAVEDRYKVKLELGFNDAGEIVVLPPPKVSVPSQRRAMTMAEMQAAAAPVINTAYTQAAEEFTKKLKPILSNMVYGRAMLTNEEPKNVAKDLAAIINSNQAYAGFFNMQGRSATPAATPATPAAPAASAAKPATSSDKEWWED